MGDTTPVNEPTTPTRGPYDELAYIVRQAVWHAMEHITDHDWDVAEALVATTARAVIAGERFRV